MTQQLNTATSMCDAMQNAALADMMHDALRSSVLQGLLAAQAGMQSFHETFELLEKTLAEPSDMLEAHNKTVCSQGEQLARQAHVGVLVTMVSAAIAVLLLCARIIRRVLGGLAVAGRLAEAVVQSLRDQAQSLVSSVASFRLA